MSMTQKWIVELYVEGRGFMCQAGGYESETGAKSAAARAFKSDLHMRRVRVVSDDKPTVIYEATFRPGERTKWAPHPGNEDKHELTT